MNGYALLIGMNRVDLSHYGNDKDYCGATSNLAKMRKLLNPTYFSPSNIHLKDGTNTKWGDIVSTIGDIKTAISKSGEESYVFIYFSGHGALIEDKDGDEQQFLCFYDRMILKNQIRNELAGFNAKTIVYMAIDACKSGDYGAFRAIKEITYQYPHLKTLLHSIPEIKKIDNPHKIIFSPASILNTNYPIYKDVIAEFGKKYAYTGSTNVWYTSSTEKFGDADKGFECEGSPFTSNFSIEWKNRKPGENYSKFGFNSFDGTNENYFKENYPLIFKTQ